MQEAQPTYPAATCAQVATSPALSHSRSQQPWAWDPWAVPSPHPPCPPPAGLPRSLTHPHPAPASCVGHSPSPGLSPICDPAGLTAATSALPPPPPATLALALGLLDAQRSPHPRGPLEDLSGHSLQGFSLSFSPAPRSGFLSTICDLLLAKSTVACHYQLSEPDLAGSEGFICPPLGPSSHRTQTCCRIPFKAHAGVCWGPALCQGLVSW